MRIGVNENKGEWGRPKSTNKPRNVRSLAARVVATTLVLEPSTQGVSWWLVAFGAWIKECTRNCYEYRIW